MLYDANGTDAPSLGAKPDPFRSIVIAESAPFVKS